MNTARKRQSSVMTGLNWRSVLPLPGSTDDAAAFLRPVNVGLYTMSAQGTTILPHWQVAALHVSVPFVQAVKVTLPGDQSL